MISSLSSQIARITLFYEKRLSRSCFFTKPRRYNRKKAIQPEGRYGLEG
uniref:Uncharacterized protein n=1 Tax=Rhizophora mucronata TaxID=61149 RepID=A0A2P2LX30_RHIMU